MAWLCFCRWFGFTPLSSVYLPYLLIQLPASVHCPAIHQLTSSVSSAIQNFHTSQNFPLTSGDYFVDSLSDAPTWKSCWIFQVSISSSMFLLSLWTLFSTFLRLVSNSPCHLFDKPMPVSLENSHDYFLTPNPPSIDINGDLVHKSTLNQIQAHSAFLSI